VRTARKSRFRESTRAALPDSADSSRECVAQPLAEDIAQETWLRAVREWRRRGIPAKPAAWLTTVSRNLLFNEFRRRRSMRLEDLDPEAIPAGDAGGDPESAETETEVRQALARIPPAESRLLEAFYLERTPVAQIAARMKVSPRAVEGRLRRARAKLRRELTAGAGTSRGHRDLPGHAVGPGILGSMGRNLSMSLLLPLLLAVAMFPLALLVGRLPRRTLGTVRIVAGVAMIVLATMAAPDPMWLQGAGVAMLLWGTWMLLRPPAQRGSAPPAGKSTLSSDA
jgi:RNA polymerase sigma factor (sigma-70 family)